MMSTSAVRDGVVEFTYEKVAGIAFYDTGNIYISSRAVLNDVLMTSAQLREFVKYNIHAFRHLYLYNRILIEPNIGYRGILTMTEFSQFVTDEVIKWMKADDTSTP